MGGCCSKDAVAVRHDEVTEHAHDGVSDASCVLNPLGVSLFGRVLHTPVSSSTSVPGGQAAAEALQNHSLTLPKQCVRLSTLSSWMQREQAQF